MEYLLRLSRLVKCFFFLLEFFPWKKEKKCQCRSAAGRKRTIDAKAFLLASIVVSLEVCISESYARI